MRSKSTFIKTERKNRQTSTDSFDKVHELTMTHAKQKRPRLLSCHLSEDSNKNKTLITTLVIPKLYLDTNNWDLLELESLYSNEPTTTQRSPHKQV